MVRAHSITVVLAGLLLAGCTTVAPIASERAAAIDPPAASIVAEPSPSASVLAVVTHKPTPKPAPKKAPKAKPKVHHVAAKPRPTGWVCYVGKPCKVPPFSSPVWHKTVGCTVAWRKALHRTTCPPGWPPIP